MTKSNQPLKVKRVWVNINIINIKYVPNFNELIRYPLKCMKIKASPVISSNRPAGIINGKIDTCFFNLSKDLWRPLFYLGETTLYGWVYGFSN